MGDWPRKGLQKILWGTTSVWHGIKWGISEGCSGRNHIPLSWSFYPSHSTMNLGDPCISLEEVQPARSKFTLYKSWSLAPVSEVGLTVFPKMSGITTSQFQKRHVGVFTACHTLHSQLPGRRAAGLPMEVPMPKGKMTEKSISRSPGLFRSQRCSSSRTTQ